MFGSIEHTTTKEAQAIERATFIFTNGERKIGDVVFHTESRRNLIDGNLNLGVSAAILSSGATRRDKSSSTPFVT